VAAVGAALAQVQRGMELGVALGAEHSFLVYNGSVVLWSLAKPLVGQRSAAAAEALAASLEAALRSLAAAGETDAEWRLALHLHLARCMDSLGKRKEAAAMLAAQAVPLLKSDVSAPAADELVQLQARLLGDDAAGLKKLREDYAREPRRAALLTAQLLRDGGAAVATSEAAAAELLGAVAGLSAELAAVLRAEGGEEAMRKAVAALAGNCEFGAELVTLAARAAEWRLLGLAACIAQRVGSAPELAARTRALLVLQTVRVARLDSADTFTREMVSVRVEAVRGLEELLGSARRTGELELLQDVCVAIWNVSLPLLQPALVSLVAQPLELAAAALEEIQSPLLGIRAALHLEMARRDAALDLVKKASANVAKALALDVPLDGKGERPLDKPLLRLKARLDLKLDAYRTPDSSEETALVLLDQLRSAAPALKKQIISQLQQLMASSEPAAEGAEDLRRERFFLWAELMKAAWAERMRAPARAAAMAVASTRLATEVAEPEMARLQAEARFVSAETLIDEMRVKETAAEAEKAKGAPGEVAEEAAELAAELAGLRARALAEMEAGMALGSALGEEHLVYNGCIYIWNYSQALLRSGELEPLLPSLRACVAAMRAADQAALRKEPQLLKLACAFAAALAQGLEARATAAPAPGATRRSFDAKDAAAAAALKEAEAACQWASELAAERHRIKRSVTAAWARVQAYAGAKEPQVGPERESGAYARLELLQQDLLEGPAKAAALAKAKELLLGDAAGSPLAEPELWVRAAQQSLALGDLGSVVQDCERALAPLRRHEAAPQAAPLKAPLKDEWRWYGLAEFVHGDAIARLLQPHQALALQAQLHAQALERLSSAMGHALKGGESALVFSAASRLWQHCAPFAGGATKTGGVRVSLVRAPVARAITALEGLGAEPRVEDLRVKLYELMLSVLAEAAEWGEGLTLLRRAFGSLPAACHEPLWEHKVRFMCQGGSKGLAGEMLKIKDFPVTTQAKIWAALAASSTNKGEQLHALLRAAEVLAPHPRHKVGRLIALAEWLFCNGMPPADAQDQLLAAVDLLMEAEDDGLADDEADADDDASSVVSGSTARHSRPASSSASVTRASKPVAAGGDDDALTVRHLEQMGRVYAMLARMAPSVGARTDRCLIACHYLARIWAQSAAYAAGLEASGALPASIAPLGEGHDAAAAYATPSEVGEWATWKPSARLLALLGALTDSDAVLGPASIPQPELTAFYLQYLADALAEAGLLLHALLPLSLLRHLGAVAKQPAIELRAALQQARTLRCLGLAEEPLPALRPTAHQKKANAAKLAVARQTATPKPPAAASGRLAGPRVPQPTSAARPEAAVWVEVASLLLGEGEWSAAGEWLDEARPLLEALGDERALAACLSQQARLAHLRADPATALELQSRALATPLEVPEWCACVLALSAYQTALGDADAATATLASAVSLCAEAASAYPSSAAQARVASAELQLALGTARLAQSPGARVSVTAHRAVTAEVASLFESAAATLQSVGADAAALKVLVARAELAEDEARTNDVAERSDADLALEEEESRLQQLAELLAAAAAPAERVLFTAAPRGLAVKVSLPVARKLARLKHKMARVELRLASLRTRVEAAHPPDKAHFPLVAGREGEASVAAFVEGPRAASFEPMLSHEHKALLHASAAVTLAGAAASQGAMEARLARGDVLLTLARADGWGTEAWREPAEEQAAEEEEAPVGEEVAAAEPAPPPVAGAREASEGEAELRAVWSLAVDNDQMDTAHAAALALAEAAGTQRPAECARWLSAAQSSGARQHWLQTWRRACAPSCRFALLLSQLDALRREWAQPARSAQWQAAVGALSHEGTGCAAWRSLALPADPLASLLALLPAGMRVLQLTRDEPRGLLYGAVTVPAEDEPRVLVARGAVSPAALAAALGLVSDAKRLFALAALSQSKADLAPETREATGPSALEQAEAAMAAAMASVEALLAPVLRPLGAAFAAPAEGSEQPPTVVICDASLAPIPFELLRLLRQRHLGLVSRELSAAFFAQRLACGPPEAKGNAVGYAVDVRNELALPSSRTKKGDKAPTPLGVAFDADVLGGLGRAWGPALLGYREVPSTAQLQRTLSRSGVFLFHGPGSLLASLAPEHVAPLDLRATAAALLFDQQESSAASQRMAKEANGKDAARLALEEPHATAALLSLGGVKTVVAHHWGAAPAERHKQMVEMLRSLTEGKSVADALRKAYALPELPGEGAADAVAPLPSTSAIVYGLPHFKLL